MRDEKKDGELTLIVVYANCSVKHLQKRTSFSNAYAQIFQKYKFYQQQKMNKQFLVIYTLTSIKVVTSKKSCTKTNF